MQICDQYQANRALPLPPPPQNPPSHLYQTPLNIPSSSAAAFTPNNSINDWPILRAYQQYHASQALNFDLTKMMYQGNRCNLFQH